jgi:hypothetical protein
VSIQRELADLREHWGTAYRISVGNGIWRATRRDTGAMLTAESADELLRLIRDDYRVRPVPRQ